MEEHRISVVGESFKNDDGSSRQEEIRRCRVGESVLLEREPDNPYDSRCVKVVSERGVQIGNLPRGTAWLSERIDAGDDITAVIEFIGATDDGQLGVLLEVSVDGAAPVSRPMPAARATAQPPRKAGETAKGCLWLALLGAVIYGVATCSSGDKTPAAETARPIVRVTAQELTDAYAANEARAQQTYGASRLRVSGEVKSIDLDLTDDPVIILKTDAMFGGVHAALAEDWKPMAADLEKGEFVNLLCGRVSEVAGTPMLSECERAP